MPHEPRRPHEVAQYQKPSQPTLKSMPLHRLLGCGKFALTSPSKVDFPLQDPCYFMDPGLSSYLLHLQLRTPASIFNFHVDDHMDGRGEQPGPAPGGSAGRSENLQGGPRGCLQGGPGDVGLPGAHWPPCRCCDLKIDLAYRHPSKR